ncbi:MAG: universal stress protein [Nitrospirae bacterium]|nr:universal stress protein [Nitrospirota bacterium]
MNILVVYNGSLCSKHALRTGIEKARQENGRLILLHVFRSNLFIDYEGGYRAQVTARQESLRYLEEAGKTLQEEAAGIWSKVIVAEGSPEDMIVQYVKEEDIDIVYSPFRYKAVSNDVSCLVYTIPNHKLIPAGVY